MKITVEAICATIPVSTLLNESGIDGFCEIGKCLFKKCSFFKIVN
jgi:hypothetical protein